MTLFMTTVTLHFNKGTYSPYEKLNDRILYINALSNHPPKIIKHLSTAIDERLLKNSSNEEIFNTSKVDYGKVVKESNFQLTKLEHKKTGGIKQGTDVETLYGSTHHSTKMSAKM